MKAPKPLTVGKLIKQLRKLPPKALVTYLNAQNETSAFMEDETLLHVHIRLKTLVLVSEETVPDRNMIPLQEYA